MKEINFEAGTFIGLFYDQLSAIQHFCRLAGLNEKYLQLRLITHTPVPFSFFLDEYVRLEEEANDILVLIYEVRDLIRTGREYKKTLDDTEKAIETFLQKNFNRVFH